MAPPSREARRAGRLQTRPRRQSASKEKENPTAVEAAEVEIEIMDLANYNPSINWLMYGPEGMGKTALVGGAPNAVFLSTEPGGPVSARRKGRDWRLIPAPDWEHALSAVKWADKNLGPDDFLIIDSHTRMQKEYIRWLLRMRHEENAARDLDIPAIQDHQKWQNGFTRWTDHIIKADYNSIFVATDMIKEDETGDDIVMPSFDGKNYTIAKYISAQMMIVSYYAVSKTASTADETIRRCLFQPYPPWVAKDRYSVFGKFRDVPEGEFDLMEEWIGEIRKSQANAS